jgi:hypothetical protein
VIHLPELHLYIVKLKLEFEPIASHDWSVLSPRDKVGKISQLGERIGQSVNFRLPRHTDKRITSEYAVNRKQSGSLPTTRLLGTDPQATI